MTSIFFLGEMATRSPQQSLLYQKEEDAYQIRFETIDNRWNGIRIREDCIPDS